MPTLTIDEKQITVPNGTLILQAARQLGIEVPVFCYHSRLASVGMCRMCLVEVGTPRMGPDRKPVLKPDGTPEIAWQPKPATACTTAVSEGMVVKVYSPAAIEARRGIVEFLLTSHPLDCPICDKGGECPLQEQTLTHGPGASRFVYNDKFFNEKSVALGPLIVLDRERCVQCARCIRFQDEIAGDSVLGFYDRGRGMEIITYSDPPFDSKFSGNTTDICPVGALTTEDFRFAARPWEMQYTASVCPHCAVGCNLTISARNGTDIKRILPRANTSVNDIWICDKGRFGYHFAESENRLTTPLVRRNGELSPATWKEALELVAQRFGAARAQDPASVAGLIGDRVANEDMHLFFKLFREVLGSSNLRSVGSPVDLNGAIGLPAGSDITRLGKDSLIFVIGTDVEEEAPVAYLRLKQGKESGAALIVANGRPTKLDRAGTALRYRYGAEGLLLAAMLSVVVDEKLSNADFVAQRTSGFEALAEALKAHGPDSAAAKTGVPADAIRTAARAVAQAQDAVFVCGRELHDHAKGLLQTLVLVTGHAGRANNGVLYIGAHNNTQGVRALMPPHHLRPARVLYVVGAEAEREEAEFVVVQDLFLTHTARHADVVLPAQSFAERDGTYTNYERRVQHFAPAILPAGDSRPDWEIIAALAAELDASWKFQSAAEVFDDLANSVPAFKSMSHAQLRGKLFRSRDHFLYEGTSFMTAGGAGMVYPSAAENPELRLALEFTPPAEPPGGLQLVTPRLLYNAGTLISESVLLHAVRESAHADLNRADAERLGIADGDEVQLETVAGTAVLPARVDGRAPEGVVVAPANLKPVDTRALLSSGAVSTPVTVTKA